TYVSYPSWSPYDYTCVRFRIVVFDDPYYYPYRYYGGTRVVFTRPYRPEPRFIFKDRQATDAFITRVRERPVNDDRRRDVGVRGRDLGGTGVIPPPNIQPPRRRPGSEEARDDDDRGRGGRPDRRDHRDRPDRPAHRDDSGRPAPPGAAARGAPRTGDRAAAATGRAWCSVHHDRRRPAPHRHHRRRLDARPRHAEPAARRGSGLRRGRVPPLWAQAGRR